MTVYGVYGNWKTWCGAKVQKSRYYAVYHMLQNADVHSNLLHSPCNYRQHCTQRKAPLCKVTQRAILSFFALQGWHVALMGVKFDVEEWTKGAQAFNEHASLRLVAKNGNVAINVWCGSGFRPFVALITVLEVAYLLCLLQQFLDVTMVCGLRATMRRAQTCSLTNQPKLSARDSLVNRYLTINTNFNLTDHHL